MAEVPEAPMEETDAGLVPAGEGWFVLNAREARWIHREGRGELLPFTGWSDEEAKAHFPQLGVNLYVLEPGEPIGMYHWEADAEEFLILSGEATLVIEGEERPLGQWDFVHCPPNAEHIIVASGNHPCIVVAVGARSRLGGEWGGYRPNDAAAEHGASVDEETPSPKAAYARFEEPQPAPYRDGLLGD